MAKFTPVSSRVAPRGVGDPGSTRTRPDSTGRARKDNGQRAAGLVDLGWLLRRWADLLDSRFVIPGTSIRFGIDPILSLIPYLGSLATPVFAMLLMVQGIRQRVPKIILLRMLFNAFADALISLVPVLGTVGDIFFRANNRNMALLERFAQPGQRPTGGDYVFVFAMAALFGALIAIPLFLSVWVMSYLLSWLGLAA